MDQTSQLERDIDIDGTDASRLITYSPSTVSEWLRTLLDLGGAWLTGDGRVKAVSTD